jgi:hypothetical protein
MSDKLRIVEGWDGFEDDDFMAQYGGPDPSDDMEQYDPYEDDYSEEDSDMPDEMENLCYLLRKFFSMSRLEAEVSYSDGIIDIFVFMEKKEKISSLLRCFELVNKLKRDTLQGYHSEFEIWENKNGYPVFNFKFSMDELDNDGSPF